jgi:hypothetical protein
MSMGRFANGLVLIAAAIITQRVSPISRFAANREIPRFPFPTESGNGGSRRIGKRGFPIPDSGRVGNRGFPSPFPGQIGNGGNGNWALPGLPASATDSDSEHPGCAPGPRLQPLAARVHARRTGIVLRQRPPRRIRVISKSQHNTNLVILVPSNLNGPKGASHESESL